MTFLLSACGGSGSDGGNYSFTAEVEAVLTDTARVLSRTSDTVHDLLQGEGLFETFMSSLNLKSKIEASAISCNSTVCMDATAISGKYYGAGLLIQSENNGLSANFGGEAWSDIVGTSTKYDFDTATPVTNAGTLYCCNGNGGNLAGTDSYISDVSFMLAYADVTFTYSGSGNGAMNTAHTVRFIFAEDADDSIAGEQRGDLLYHVGGGIFAWIDSADGSQDLTRPAAPVQMNSSVTDWTNPGEKGNQLIPVIYASAIPASGTGMIFTSEDELAAPATYSFVFPTEKLVIFPTLQDNGVDAGQVSDVKSLLEKIHLQGLPHSTATLGGAGDTILTITPL